MGAMSAMVDELEVATGSVDEAGRGPVRPRGLVSGIAMKFSLSSDGGS